MVHDKTRAFRQIKKVEFCLVLRGWTTDVEDALFFCGGQLSIVQSDWVKEGGRRIAYVELYLNTHFM